LLGKQRIKDFRLINKKKTYLLERLEGGTQGSYEVKIHVDRKKWVAEYYF
jgi:hypothetical protein